LNADATRQPSSARPQTRRTSRRRGDTLKDAIFRAVLAQMSVHGFSGLTMEGVASCAHTGKAALYRRWSCKEDLVVEALNHVLPQVDSPPDSGDLRSDLAAVLAVMRDSINSPAGCAVLGIMGELDRDHEFVKTIKERVLAPRKRSILAVLQRAADRGEIPPDAVTPLVAETAPALVLMRVIGEGPPVTAAYIDQILDDVMMPLLGVARAPRRKKAARR
jgi:AcrR family transcriptional regulator